MPFRLEHIHVFALIHDGKVTLFDTGMNIPATYSSLEKSLNALDRSITDIDSIFITHFHGDHCGIAGRIKELSGAVIHMSETGEQILHNNGQEEVLARKIETFYTEQGLPKNEVALLIELFRQFRKATIPFEIDELLDFNKTYRVGDAEFTALSTPGHTRDHVCYYFGASGILLAGDHVLPDITPNLGPDLFMPTFRPLKSFITSLSAIEDLAVAGVFPAHGAPYTDLKGRIAEIKDHHVERKNLIYDSVQKGKKTAFQISQDIFGTDLDQFDRFLALNETYVHLIELLHEGLIKRETGQSTICYYVTT